MWARILGFSGFSGFSGDSGVSVAAKKGGSPSGGRCAPGTGSRIGGGGDLLSRFRSIIGAPGFNFSVRDGKRWSPRAVAALMPFAVVSVCVAGAWRPPRARTSMTVPEECVRSGRRVSPDTGRMRMRLCVRGSPRCLRAVCTFSCRGDAPGGKGSGY